ncbi:MAG: PEP-utilizing enzyme [Beijerinckiaceae bacterium]|jgi:phosphotransferase system enzyme I (PtsI)|nr:PEP-utilizing enzyme [Beijerinckiaceae bacterium]
MERRLEGLSASPGIAVGMIQPLLLAEGQPRKDAPACEEREALHAAIARVKADLTRLSGRLSGIEAGILGFQIALLEDPELVHHAETRIADGLPADQAWIEGMAREILHYRDAPDLHFRARADDLADLRDAVLQALRAEPGPPLALKAGGILAAEDLTPSLFLRMDWQQGSGIVLGGGSMASHVAILARARGIPMVVGVGKVWADLSGPVLVDGDAGIVVAAPSAVRLAQAKASPVPAATVDDGSGPTLTRDGHRIAVELNVAALSDLDGLSPELCDGIGLVRTEFLIEHALYDEDAQFEAYAQLLHWAEGRPVTLRTIDAGGDKPLAGYSIEGERHPFLGLRGLRLSLARPDVFRIQLRAILRAAAWGPVRLLLPMVTAPAEVAAARAHVAEVAAALAGEGTRFVVPPIGMMLEVPAAAMAPGQFAVDFYSIGTNDLAQFACAAARDDLHVSTLADPRHPGLLAMIEHAIREAQALRRPLSLCGDAATDRATLEALLAIGIESVSVAPVFLPRLRSDIRQIDCGMRDRP